jgi:hypothetical protein
VQAVNTISSAAKTTLVRAWIGAFIGIGSSWTSDIQTLLESRTVS